MNADLGDLQNSTVSSEQGSTSVTSEEERVQRLGASLDAFRCSEGEGTPPVDIEGDPWELQPMVPFSAERAAEDPQSITVVERTRIIVGSILKKGERQLPPRNVSFSSTRFNTLFDKENRPIDVANAEKIKEVVASS
jgi:hypothetical protein